MATAVSKARPGLVIAAVSFLAGPLIYPFVGLLVSLLVPTDDPDYAIKSWWCAGWTGLGAVCCIGIASMVWSFHRVAKFHDLPSPDRGLAMILGLSVLRMATGILGLLVGLFVGFGTWAVVFGE